MAGTTGLEPATSGVTGRGRIGRQLAIFFVHKMLRSLRERFWDLLQYVLQFA